MQRVVILGRGGAGGSAFARELEKTTGLPVIEAGQILLATRFDPHPA